MFDEVIKMSEPLYIEDVVENANEFIKNEYWKEVYVSAPTRRCQIYIELDWYYGRTGNTTAFDNMKKLESKLGIADYVPK